MKHKKIWLFPFMLVLALVLAACGNGDNNEHANHGTEKPDNKADDSSSMHGDHGDMNHSGSAKVPEGLKTKENPTYKVGSEAIIKADHMEGMNGATAKIVGAYETTAYAVTYTPTTGGEKVTNHKWVIHEELKDAPAQPLKAGDEVTLEADHMEGMNGAKAVIDSAEQTTVYMFDYTPTTGGETMKNHKWVVESELAPK
ncbi:YdhK family protein [Peribacillus sp. SCS-155]|uniref:YdhK family protein n=1 Tax=Peribacillus sedimenti TaxID=3115297 RepID=UPI0039067C25